MSKRRTSEVDEPGVKAPSSRGSATKERAEAIHENGPLRGLAVTAEGSAPVGIALKDLLPHHTYRCNLSGRKVLVMPKKTEMEHPRVGLAFNFIYGTQGFIDLHDHQLIPLSETWTH